MIQNNNFFKITQQLVIYRGVCEDAVLKRLFVLLSGNSINNRLVSKFLSKLITKSEQLGLSGDILRKYILYLLLTDENPYSLACEFGNLNNSSTLQKLSSYEIELIFDALEKLDFSTQIPAYGKILPYKPNKPHSDTFIDLCIAASTPSQLMQTLTRSYSENGIGKLYSNKMFTFENNKLKPAVNPGFVSLGDIIFYERQKQLICKNIEAFLNNNAASNMLLTGPKGTGKSSCIRALVEKYAQQGLLLVSVPREQYSKLPLLIKKLGKRGKKFIVMLDDLSFDLSHENAGNDYKYLKSIMEGSVEGRPPNVLFAATSNRRALVTENWSDKQGTTIEDGEIHASDAINEKQSLKDRFGLLISFPKPSPAEFCEIVKQLLKKQHIEVSDEQIKQKSAEWELGQSGLSGRAARNLADMIQRSGICN